MLVIALAAALLGGASYAWFTGGDNVNGTIKTGTLAITAETVGGVDFSFEDLAPGGETAVWAVELVNDGSLEMYYRAKVEGSWEETGLDSAKILVSCSEDDQNFPEFAAIDDNWFVGGDDSMTLAAGNSATYYFKFKLAESADDDYQGQTFTATVTAEATQADNQTDPINWGNN